MKKVETYCFRVYVGIDEHLSYIEATSLKEAKKELEKEWFPDAIDYKFLGKE